MHVPKDEYSFDSFVQYLIDHSKEVFHEEEQKKWLKIYCLINSGSDSLDRLFSGCQVTPMGEIFEVSMGIDGDPDWDETFYFANRTGGLTLVFTSAIQENFALTLGDRLRRTRGVEVMWARHDFFNEVIESIIHSFNGYVKRFMARRSRYDEAVCKIRPNYERRFNYTGEDGSHVLRELMDLYGVFPESAYIQISEILQIQITNEGFYAAKEISPLAFKVFFTYLETLAERVISLSDISKSFSFQIAQVKHGDWEGPVVNIEPGIILLKGRNLDSNLVKGLAMEIQEDFSFTNVRLVEGSLSYSATVTDEMKGTIFDISASDNHIVLMPRYNTTFESFLRFYRRITENVDRAALLQPYIAP